MIIRMNAYKNGLAEQIVLGLGAKHLHGSWIEIDEPSLGQDENGFRCMLYDGPETDFTVFQFLFGTRALSNVMDDRIQEFFAMDDDGTAVNLDIVNRAVGPAMAKQEMVLVALDRFFHFLGDFFGRQRIDFGDFHLFELCDRPAVIVGCGWIGIDNRTRLRIDQKHGRMVVLKQAAVLRLGFELLLDRLCLVLLAQEQQAIEDGGHWIDKQDRQGDAPDGLNRNRPGQEQHAGQHGQMYDD